MDPPADPAEDNARRQLVSKVVSATTTKYLSNIVLYVHKKHKAY